MASFEVDYAKQPFALLDSNGSPTMLMFYLTDVEKTEKITKEGILIGSFSIGFMVMLMITLWITSRSDRRTSTIFILNQANLLCNTIRASLYLSYIFGPFNSIPAVFFGDFQMANSSAVVIAIAANIFQLAVVVLTETSLLMLVSTVMFRKRSKITRWMIPLSYVFAGIIVLLWTIAIALNIKQTLSFTTTSFPAIYAPVKILYASSIVLFSMAFGIKLIQAIRIRRELNINDFGPLQILLAGAIGTMIIPASMMLIDSQIFILGFGQIASFILVISIPIATLCASKISGQDMLPTSESPQTGSVTEKNLRGVRVVTPGEKGNVSVLSSTSTMSSRVSSH